MEAVSRMTLFILLTNLAARGKLFYGTSGTFNFFLEKIQKVYNFPCVCVVVVIFQSLLNDLSLLGHHLQEIYESYSYQIYEARNRTIMVTTGHSSQLQLILKTGRK